MDNINQQNVFYITYWMYTTGTIPGIPGLRSSAVMHPTLLRGMANSIAASTLTTNAVTRTTGVMGPNMIGGNMINGNMMGATNMMGEIQGD